MGLDYTLLQILHLFFDCVVICICGSFFSSFFCLIDYCNLPIKSAYNIFFNIARIATIATKAQVKAE